MNIIGAGLSGLICGALNAQARIFESNPSSFTSHRAILRFREDKIARALGLNFRRVIVRKGIFLDGEGEVPASIGLANWYSRKVRGVIGESSIWNLAPSERFIAPDDLHAILADICGSRVAWNFEITGDILRHEWGDRGWSISTIPLPVLLNLLGVLNWEGLLFDHSPIVVSRYTIPNCDVFQTLYFPDPSVLLYRATLTGSLLTLEYSNHTVAPCRSVSMKEEARIAMEAFGIDHKSAIPQLAGHKQSFGKIVPVADSPRKALLHYLTTHHHIYSLGRFATWRNVLLDDVYEDVFAIRKMMSLSQYDINLERMKT